MLMLNANGKETERKSVPVERTIRDQLLALTRQAVNGDDDTAGMDRSRPPAHEAIEHIARQILRDSGFGDDAHLGWMMVAVASEFWRESIAAIPFNRRVLLLPHCLRDPATCPAKMTERELLCEGCGACDLAELRRTAAELGYQTLIAEGSPAVVDRILRGEADAILGIACLNSLEKAFDRILVAGLPCAAVPLHEPTCARTRTDLDRVREMLAIPYCPDAVAVPHFLAPLQTASRIFEPATLGRLLGTTLAKSTEMRMTGDDDPLGRTEWVAINFLREGGKHLRPFVTLASYTVAVEAISGERNAAIPDAVAATAMAMEIFHKASLIHDDIEDADAFRYGRPAIHRRFGIPTAINLGDYLLGRGYQLIADLVCDSTVDTAAVADVLRSLATAHTRLSEGQGAELFIRRTPGETPSVATLLRIDALKTAPAFEAAILAGLRLADTGRPASNFTAWVEPVARFARQVGVGFQILNDLDDWKPRRAGTRNGRRRLGSDLVGGRPTLLSAMAMERLGAEDRAVLRQLLRETPETESGMNPGNAEDETDEINELEEEALSASGVAWEAWLDQVGTLYEKADASTMAESLVERCRKGGHTIADEFGPPPLQRLFHYLTDLLLRE